MTAFLQEWSYDIEREYDDADDEDGDFTDLGGEGLPAKGSESPP